MWNLDDSEVVGRITSSGSVLTICSSKSAKEIEEIAIPWRELVDFLDDGDRRQGVLYVIFHQSVQQFRPTNLERLFCDMPHLKDISLGYLNTEQVISMRSMFEGCTELQELDLTTMDTRNVENMGNMFTNCKSLKHVYMSLDFEFGYTQTNRDDVEYIFEGCNPEVKFHIMDYKRDERGTPHKYEVAEYSLSDMERAIQAYLAANYSTV